MDDDESKIIKCQACIRRFLVTLPILHALRDEWELILNESSVTITKFIRNSVNKIKLQKMTQNNEKVENGRVSSSNLSELTDLVQLLQC